MTHDTSQVLSTFEEVSREQSKVERFALCWALFVQMIEIFSWKSTEELFPMTPKSIAKEIFKYSH